MNMLTTLRLADYNTVRVADKKVELRVV